MGTELHKKSLYLARRGSSERRSEVRYSFSATAYVLEIHSHARVTGRTSDLACGGCYVDAITPFPVGTLVTVRIHRESRSFSTKARVVHAEPGMGMSLAFTLIEPEQLNIVEKWVHELSGGAPAKTPAPAREKKDAAEEIPEQDTVHALKYLILMLIQKSVLTEIEGKALLGKILK